ncbi:MAG: alpha-L-arabinofuranosidase C-terminal domain-containing protein [Candidatus Dormibacteria bacterium]
MPAAKVTLGREPRGEITSLLFGALTEHFGLGMYGGIWDAERHAPRADVKGAARALGLGLLRYPGGCFSDWYHWKDGVGPLLGRPTHDRTYWTDFRFGDAISEEMARAFGPPETNSMGTDEFLQYCVDIGAEPFITANYGSGTAREAAEWVHYCNSGRSARAVRRWSIGNETYGPWEPGHCGPDDYARGFREFAGAMRAEDPTIRLTAVGTLPGDSQYDDGWDVTVLGETGDLIHSLSVHYYFPGPALRRPLRDNEVDYLQTAAAPGRLGGALTDVVQLIDTVPSAKGRVKLMLDEWNLWAEWSDLLTTNHRLCDGVYFAGCWNRIFELADRIEATCISHLVNCMGLIQTRGDRHFVTAGYLVTMLYRDAARERFLPAEVDAPVLSVPAWDLDVDEDVMLTTTARSILESTPAVDAVATVDGRGVTVFVTNAHFTEAAEVKVSGLPAGGAGRFRLVTGDGPYSRNEIDAPNALHFSESAVTVDGAGHCVVEVPPHTVGALLVDHR